MAFKLLCLALTLSAAVSAAPESRIVGGEHTTIENFPYIVALTYYYPRPSIIIQRCVGSLISSWHLLTSGFCFTGGIEDNFEIRAGSTNSLSGGTVVKINRVVKHPDYVGSPRTADIAVVFMQAPLGISNTINVLFLPAQNTYIPDGTSIKVVSWGFESEDGPQLETLKTINLSKVNLQECQAVYDGSTNVDINDRVICANTPGKGTCNGDSGAPMVIGQVIVGLSSYFEGCGYDDYPDVFTRIDFFTNWIMEVASSSRSGDSSGIRIAPVVL